MLEAIVSNLECIKNPAHAGDVGFDLVADCEPRIEGVLIDGGWRSISYIEYDTRVKVQPPEGHYSLIFPRSSISKYDLMLANGVGVIDESYRGNLLVRFKYIAQPKDFKVNSYGEVVIDDSNAFQNIYKQGDKIAQLVFAKSIIPELVNGEQTNTSRATGSFGSTGL
jgi:dUTP pyrophosphatase